MAGIARREPPGARNSAPIRLDPPAVADRSALAHPSPDIADAGPCGHGSGPGRHPTSEICPAAARARLDAVARIARSADLELGPGRNVPGGVPDIRLAEHGGVRPRLSASEFSRLGQLSRGHD